MEKNENEIKTELDQLLEENNKLNEALKNFIIRAEELEKEKEQEEKILLSLINS